MSRLVHASAKAASCAGGGSSPPTRERRAAPRSTAPRRRDGAHDDVALALGPAGSEQGLARLRRTQLDMSQPNPHHTRDGSATNERTPARHLASPRASRGTGERWRCRGAAIAGRYHEEGLALLVRGLDRLVVVLLVGLLHLHADGGLARAPLAEEEVCARVGLEA
eukprot:scaffold2220_cov377-Prasinococcus_capsulatus_cf.AAC.13